MLFGNKEKLSKNLYKPEKLLKKSTRDGFGEALISVAEEIDKVVVLSADVSESVRVHWFKKAFPDRYIELGVAEQNLASVASGMANYGKIPFMVTYAAFSPGRNFEQIRTLIALNNLPVKIIGTHAGVSVGADGATHQALEDIALMRVLPNMQVICPCDAIQVQKATRAIALNKKPTYLRLSRPSTEVFTTEKTVFKIGQAQVFVQGDDVTIIACGSMVYEAIKASQILKNQNIKAEVINCHTIKPLDKKTILTSAKKTRAVVTVEDHQVAGGLGSAVAELLSQELPTKMKIMGVKDQFGQSGTPEELYNYYELTVNDIVKNCLQIIKSTI